jgi:hypothetical protein
MFMGRNDTRNSGGWQKSAILLSVNYQPAIQENPADKLSCLESATYRNASARRESHHPVTEVGFEYTSHFDAHASACRVMVHEAVNSGSPIVSFLIYDAFEGRVYASYRWMNSEHKKYEDVAPKECR